MPNTSLRFEAATGISAGTWRALESMYRNSLAKEKDSIRLEKGVGDVGPAATAKLECAKNRVREDRFWP